MYSYIKDTGLEKDIPLIQKWVNTYSHIESMPMEIYLQDWYKGKSEYLLKMFGNKLIHRQEIEYNRPLSHIQSELRQIFRSMDDYIDAKRFWNKSLSYYIFGHEDPHQDSRYPTDWKYFAMANDDDEISKKFDEWNEEYLAYIRCASILNAETLALNEISYETTLKKLKIHVGKNARPFRTVHNLIKVMENILIEKYPSFFSKEKFQDFLETIERMRIIHSQILNKKKIKGTLCLSIHPLDYMTMSDNEYDWTSCMRWRENDEFETGCYHAGTIEMMNSNNVVVAYLEGKEKWYPFSLGDGNISNKKWRELFIVDHDFIIGIKGYPYCSDSLEKQIINILAEMAKNTLDFEYRDEIIKNSNDTIPYLGEPSKYFTISTCRYMYNDISSNGCNMKWAIAPNYKKIEFDEYTYGNEAYCTVCGNPIYDEECTVCSKHLDNYDEDEE